MEFKRFSLVLVTVTLLTPLRAQESCAAGSKDCSRDPEDDHALDQEVSLLQRQKAQKIDNVAEKTEEEIAKLEKRKAQVLDELDSIDRELMTATLNASDPIYSSREVTFGGGSCADKDQVCGKFKKNADCACNQKCEHFGNCCIDFYTVCVYPPGEPSGAPLFEFYMYRSVSDEEYPPLNTNMASLGGALWYLQNEVVNRCDDGRGGGKFGYRRFRIARMLRYKVKMRATKALLDQGMHFGSRVAFDKGKCTGAWYPQHDCKQAWEKYGYHIGCNVLGQGPYPSCAPVGSDNGEGFCPITYPDPVWYSLPGPCPDTEYFNHCNAQAEPGGYTKGTPTGSRTSTYSYEFAGEIDLDELSGIKGHYKDHADFCRKGCLEYVKYGYGSDKGKCVSFWNNRHDANANKARVKAADDLFKKHYPDYPRDAELKPPKCDFNKDKFYQPLWR
jgi:hypothetical protein